MWTFFPSATCALHVRISGRAKQHIPPPTGLTQINVIILQLIFCWLPRGRWVIRCAVVRHDCDGREFLSTLHARSVGQCNDKKHRSSMIDTLVCLVSWPHSKGRSGRRVTDVSRHDRTFSNKCSADILVPWFALVHPNSRYKNTPWHERVVFYSFSTDNLHTDVVGTPIFSTFKFIIMPHCVLAYFNLQIRIQHIKIRLVLVSKPFVDK